MILSVPVVLNRAGMIKSVHFQIKIVESYNYLETILDKNWLLSITPIERIRRLSKTLLNVFYQFVESVFTFSFICWF